MSVKCQGRWKNGNECTFNGTWTHGGNTYCKRHAPDGAIEIGASDSRATVRPQRAKGVCLSMILDEIYQGIRRRLQCGELAQSQQLTDFAAMSLDDRHIVTRRAIELCGSQEDVLLIARSIPGVVDTLERARREERIPFVLHRHHLERIGCEWDRNQEHKAFLFEKGNYATFPDVEITIANCAPTYMDVAGMSFTELCANEMVIYMGPKGAARSPLGGELPPVDSEWYIPLPAGCPLRRAHNQIKIVQILKDIAEGRDNAERYLALRGKFLLCVCMPVPCHCEVYVEVIRALTRHK